MFNDFEKSLGFKAGPVEPEYHDEAEALKNDPVFGHLPLHVAKRYGWFHNCGDHMIEADEMGHVIFCPGSFNPMHLGHMAMTRAVIHNIKNDRTYNSKGIFRTVYIPAAWEYSGRKQPSIFRWDTQREYYNKHFILTNGYKMDNAIGVEVAEEHYLSFSGRAPLDLNFLTVIDLFMSRFRSMQAHVVVGADNAAHLFGVQLKNYPSNSFRLSNLFVKPWLCTRADVEIPEDINYRTINHLSFVTLPSEFQGISSTKIRKELHDKNGWS